jgi:hypothetical protein
MSASKSLAVSRTTASITASLKPPSLVEYTNRNICNTDLLDLGNRLRCSALYATPATTTNAFAEQFRSVVTAVLNAVVPVRQMRRYPSKPVTRWLSCDAIKAKRIYGHLERMWIRTRLESHRVAYRTACRRANALMNQSRSDFSRLQLHAAIKINGEPRGNFFDRTVAKTAIP